jgi:hypothetical protein
LFLYIPGHDWSISQSKSYSKYIQNEVIHMLDFLIGNILFQSEGLVFQQTICIPVGTNCIPVTGNIGYTRRRKRNKNTTQYMLDTTTRKQTQITYIRNESSCKQLETFPIVNPFIYSNIPAAPFHNSYVIGRFATSTVIFLTELSCWYKIDKDKRQPPCYS